ncbi:MAG: hypothetical protein IT336_00570 [Thermomicrobiales bacterium]|nr:hypothetical protein [Thermomicrobiales bacterium]
MTMILAPVADGSRVRVASKVNVLGKLGQCRHAIIAKRANAMLDEFAACVRVRVERQGDQGGNASS